MKSILSFSYFFILSSFAQAQSSLKNEYCDGVTLTADPSIFSLFFKVVNDSRDWVSFKFNLYSI